MLTRATVPVVLVRRQKTGTDAYGTAVYGIALTVVDGVFAPGGSSETTDNRDQVVTEPTVFLPGVDLSAVDAIVTGATVTGDAVATGEDGWPEAGDRWEVSGAPKLWPRNPFTGKVRPRPLEVALQKVSG